MRTGEECACDRKTDTVLRSSDGKLFGAHTAYLYHYSGELGREADPNYLPVGETVQLSVPGDVVSLILKFAHPQRPPSLNLVHFDTVAQLADAVEKYRVFSGIEVCYLMMECVLCSFTFRYNFDSRFHSLLVYRKNIEQHPAQVFAYAAKNGYEDLMHNAVSGTVNLPLNTMRDTLGDRHDLFSVWVCDFSDLTCAF